MGYGSIIISCPTMTRKEQSDHSDSDSEPTAEERTTKVGAHVRARLVQAGHDPRLKHITYMYNTYTVYIQTDTHIHIYEKTYDLLTH